MTAAQSIDPRTVHTRNVVLEATASLLSEEGFQRLTVEGIAERSGVARSTIYRNWPDRTDLLCDGFKQLCQFPEIPDLGSMVEELRFIGNELASGLTSSSWAKALPSLVGAAAHDPSLAEAQKQFAAERRRMTGAIFERAAERGEIANGRDPVRLAEFFAGGFFFRFLMAGAPLDQEFVESQVAAVTSLATSPS